VVAGTEGVDVDGTVEVVAGPEPASGAGGGSDGASVVEVPGAPGAGIAGASARPPDACSKAFSQAVANKIVVKTTPISLSLIRGSPR
jgi:hypothetical protein